MDINNSALAEQATAAPQKSIPIPTFFKYSKRVLLRDVINNGADFVGQRIVVGGWVKSSREIKTETPTNPSTQMMIMQHQPNKDFDCVEILQTKLPFFRSFFKVFGIAHYPVLRDKPEPHNIPKPPLQPSLAILQISDGSSVANLQVLVESSVSPTSQFMATGTCILVDGLLQPSSTKNAGKHAIELKVIRVLHIGMVHQDTYPLSKKKLPLHLLRNSAHFRPRTTTVGSVARIRSALNEGAHNFFQLNGFLFVQVPIITVTDAEGSSQKFQVTTLNLGIFKELLGDLDHIDQEQKGTNNRSRDDSTVISLETIKASMKEKSKQLDELKRSDSNREAVVAATKDLHKTTELAAQMEAAAARSLDCDRDHEQQRTTTAVPPPPPPPPPPGSRNNNNDFFGRSQAYLTVSGRLHLQSYACALGNVYSCGPRFRAKESLEYSKRSVSETWMTEVEIAFSELEDAINCAEDLVKHACRWALDNCMEDLKFLAKRVDQLILDRLKSNIEASFQRMSYSEALEILNEVKEKKHAGSKLVEWGESFTEEDENCLTEEIYKKGVVIYNHPKQVKPFYMRLNDDGKTVASFDIIMPKGGRVISGCQNEERNGVVKERIKEILMGLKEEEEGQYEWYLELTRQGCVKSSGFSMVFDLLSIHATGLTDVRDVIPFSRTSSRQLYN